MKAHELIEAAEGLDRFLKPLFALGKLRDTLVDMASVLNAAEENAKALEKVRAEVQAAKDDYQRAVDETNALKNAAAAEAKRLVDEAASKVRFAEALKAQVAATEKAFKDQLARDNEALTIRIQDAAEVEAVTSERVRAVEKREADVLASENDLATNARKLREAAQGVA